MKDARSVAAAAALGNMLNGWDSAALAGALLYLEPEFNLDSQPVLEGFVAAASLVGAAISTTFAGSGADWLGRRKVLCISALLFCVGAALMVWSPNVYMLLVARIVDGVGLGLAVTVAPMYISEVAPSEIRGQLNTLPQFAGTAGMVIAYCIAFGISLTTNPSWRMLLGTIVFPSFLYVILGIFYLPESPRWLVSKGRTREAQRILQMLRNKEDVSGEMALLVEGLDVGEDATLEEYILQPAELVDHESLGAAPEEPQIKIIDSEDGSQWVAKPVSSVAGSQGVLSRYGSIMEQGTPRLRSIPFMDPMVSLMGSFKGTLPSELSGFGSMASNTHNFEPFPDGKNDEFNVGMEDDERGYESVEESGAMDRGLASPLLSRQTTDHWDEPDLHRLDSIAGKSMSRASIVSRNTSRDRKGFLVSQSDFSAPHGSFVESIGSTGVGGGWKLGWQWTGPEGTEGKPDQGEFKRIYLFQEAPTDGSRMGSLYSLPRYGSTVSNLEPVQATALVSRPSQYASQANLKNQVGPAMMLPSAVSQKGIAWSELLEGGVKQALIVGVMLQMLEQFSGINGILNFTPEILEESGIDVLLSSVGISSDSASLLASAVINLVCLPCILIAMYMVDRLGRRAILLRTIPILVVALLALIIVNVVSANATAFAVVSALSVMIYEGFFVMGFGPIPNMLCAEIFPTRVRGLCIGICQAAMWITNILVTELFPVLDSSIGIAGTFTCFAIFCVISWIFVFLKVPETKGMPLEVIVEFFAISALGKKKQDVQGGDEKVEV